MTAPVFWLLAAACAQLAAGQAPSKYNFPEFTSGYQAAGAAVNSLASAQYGGSAPGPATGPGPYNAAAVAAGYNYPEFTGGYPKRQPNPSPTAYGPAPTAAGYSPTSASYNPAPPAGYNSFNGGYNGGSSGGYNGYNGNPSGGYNGYNGASSGGYNGYNDGYSSENGPSHYDYNYASDTSAKQEVRSPDGTVRGAYSYVDANGQTQRVQYISDSTGFHVVDGTNLPQAPSPAPAAQ